MPYCQQIVVWLQAYHRFLGQVLVQDLARLGWLTLYRGAAALWRGQPNDPILYDVLNESCMFYRVVNIVHPLFVPAGAMSKP
jgi:hypothetical protein